MTNVIILLSEEKFGTEIDMILNIIAYFIGDE
jgi:hypothetical protein